MKPMTFALPLLFAAFGPVAATYAQHLDLRPMVQQNLNYDNWFHHWAWQRSQQLARDIPNDVPLPFNATTLSQADRQNQQAWMRYNNSQYNNQNRTHQSISRWTNGAIRGIGPYYHSSGQTELLPWTFAGYHYGPYGQIYPGMVFPDNQQNLIPVWNR